LPRVGIFKDFFNLLITFSFPYHLPKSGIVQIIDMAVNLSPFEVILHAIVIRIQNDSPIK